MKTTEEMTLETIAEWTGGRLVGDGAMTVRRPAPLETATPDEIGMLADRKYLAAAAESEAGALLVSEDLEAELEDDRPRIVVPDARVALVPLLHRLDPTPTYEPGVHPTAVLEPGVQLGDAVSIGAYAVIEAGAVIGEGSRIGPHSVVGRGARMGRECYLYPHVVVYAGSVLGDRVRLHAGVRVGSDGFGYVVQGGRYVKVPQVGACVVGDDVEIGANTCVDRGSIGDTVVERGCKLDNLVQIAHNVRLGEHGVYAALTGIAGSTTIGPWAQVGGQAGVVGHLRLGKGVRLSAQAGIIGDLEDGAEVTGWPARDMKAQMKVYAASAKLPESMKRLRTLEREVESLRARLEAEEG